jgi:hypothetical protein
MAQRNPTRPLDAICALPSEAWLTPAEAASYLNTTPAALAIRRSSESGPVFGRHGSFIRYQKRSLDDWMMAQISMRRAANQDVPPPRKALAPAAVNALPAAGDARTGPGTHQQAASVAADAAEDRRVSVVVDTGWEALK